jgi:FlaG/FlaF family flagellin (archaellin)
MAQLSRPYQIGLAALGVLVLAWFAVLHRPGSSSSEPSPAPSAHVGNSSPAPSSSSPGAHTPTYHGSAPGVAGLTRDIAKAHGTVAASEQNAAQLQNKSAQASNEAASSTTSAPSAQHAATSSAPVVVHKTVAHKPAVHSSASVTVAAQAAAQQVVLKRELHQGKTVLLLFWNPKSSDDKSVRQALLSVSAHQKGKVAVHVALAGQVGRYGAMTRDVQVLQTPTLLVVNKQGLALTITGLVDRYAIEQAILEAKKASAHHA